ncbi:MAG: hypothetical protein HY820_12720 [Acidobacteria bacterium]|nr:hypothetical protein [Acidobacteriota bacterium]
MLSSVLSFLGRLQNSVEARRIKADPAYAKEVIDRKEAEQRAREDRRERIAAKKMPESKPIPPPSEVVKNSEPVSLWSYSDNEDKMGRIVKFAILQSSNALSFSFPYQGPQHGLLTIRKTAAQGNEVILRIEKGQFVCEFSGCTVNVRFDEGALQRYQAGGTTDHSTTVLFIEGASRFISQLRSAKKVVIEPTFYRQGAQVLEFDVEGFKWK